MNGVCRDPWEGQGWTQSLCIRKLLRGHPGAAGDTPAPPPRGAHTLGQQCRGGGGGGGAGKGGGGGRGRGAPPPQAPGPGGASTLGRRGRGGGGGGGHRIEKGRGRGTCPSPLQTAGPSSCSFSGLEDETTVPTRKGQGSRGLRTRYPDRRGQLPPSAAGLEQAWAHCASLVHI